MLAGACPCACSRFHRCGWGSVLALRGLARGPGLCAAFIASSVVDAIAYSVLRKNRAHRSNLFSALWTLSCSWDWHLA